MRRVEISADLGLWTQFGKAGAVWVAQYIMSKDAEARGANIPDVEMMVHAMLSREKRAKSSGPSGSPTLVGVMRVEALKRKVEWGL